MQNSGTILFPALLSDQPVQEEETQNIPMQRGSGTILLIDDETAILEIGRDILNKFGYTPLTAGSGEEGIDVYEKEKDRIDLIILDLNMPGMGGYSCLKKLLSINPDAKILIASGYSFETTFDQTIKEGAKGFVGKPYRIGELLKKIKDTLMVA